MPATAPLASEQNQHTVGVAIIGAGERGIYYVGTRMAELAAATGFRIVAVHDRLPDRAELAAEHLDALYAEAGIRHRVRAAPTLDDAVRDPAVDLVLVTTHTSAHRAPVEAAIAAGKRVYLDKPISVTLEDAEAIAAAADRSGQPVMMGFTRRYERPWIEAVRLARTPAIGTPRMVLLRSVIPYTRYFQLWHRTNAASGGAINDKGAHHFDVLNWIARSDPVAVTAIGGRSDIFAPDPTAPARCSECDRDCPYRRHETLIDKAEGVGRVPNASWLDADRPEDRNDNCVYLPGSDIDDHAIVSVRYASGLVATLFFTIFGPYAEDQETLEVVGENGRLRLERHSGKIDLVTAHGASREVIDTATADRASSHFGADLELIRTMRRFYNGEPPPAGVAGRPRLAPPRRRHPAQPCRGRPPRRPRDPRLPVTRTPLPARLMPLANRLGVTPLYGDIHNHCDLSYGHGRFEDALARAALQLDFLSVTGHAHWPDMPVDDPTVAHIVDFHVKGFAKLRAGWAAHYDALRGLTTRRLHRVPRLRDPLVRAWRLHHRLRRP